MPEREDKLYLQDILDAIRSIEEYIRGLSYEDFLMIEKRLTQLFATSKYWVRPQRTFQKRRAPIIPRYHGRKW